MCGAVLSCRDSNCLISDDETTRVTRAVATRKSCFGECILVPSLGWRIWEAEIWFSETCANSIQDPVLVRELLTSLPKADQRFDGRQSFPLLTASVNWVSDQTTRQQALYYYQSQDIRSLSCRKCSPCESREIGFVTASMT